MKSRAIRDSHKQPAGRRLARALRRCLLAAVVCWSGLTGAGRAGAADLVHEAFASTPPWVLSPWRVEQGALVVATRSSHARLTVPGTTTLGDGSAAVTVRSVGASGEHLRLGLMFRAADAGNGYFIMIRGDGGYWLGEVVAGKSEPLLTGRIDGIRADAANRVQVTFKGDDQMVLINGQPLVGRRDGRWRRGGIILWAEGTGTAAFSDLRVNDDPGAGLEAPATPAGPPTRPDSGPPPPRPEPPPSRSAARTSVAPAPDGQAAAAGPASRPLAAVAASPSALPVPAGERPSAPAGGRPPTPPVPDTPGGTSVAHPGAAVTVPAAKPKVLFQETFNPPRYRWNEDAMRVIANGEIRIRGTAGYLLSGFPFGFEDYVYRAEVRGMSAGGGTYGLVARLQRDGQSGYLFVVRDPDVFAVARLDAGRSTLLRRGGVTVPTGWKRLEVECRGETFTFRLNGAVVTTLRDDRYRGGGIGLWVDNHRQASFRDLLVLEAPELAATIRPPRPPEPPAGPPAGPSVAPPTSPPTGREPAEAPRPNLNPKPPTPAAGNAETPPDPKLVLIDERFNPPQLDWQQDPQRELAAGSLKLLSTPGRFTISGAPEARTGDYRYTAEVTRLAGPTRGLCGLVARLQPDSRTGYLLAYTGELRFVVLRLEGDSVAELARGEAPLRPGRNRLMAECEGAQLAFYVNGTLVARVRDHTFSEGGFGVYCDNGVQASFTRLLATALRSWQ